MLPAGINFGSLDNRGRSSLQGMLAAGRSFINLAPSDYVIDVTGGTALCSVVGAALSFEGDNVFQYIPPTQINVLEYDIRYVKAKSNEPE